MREIRPGQFAVRFLPPKTNYGVTLDVAPEYPNPCRLEHSLLDCRPGGLVGEIRFEGLAPGYRVGVQIEWLGGATTVRMVGADRPSVVVRGTPAGAGLAALLPLAGDYARLGIEHILGGIDHLLFVLGLVILVGFGRRLVLTITAFTLAHSITLVSAALGWAHVSPRPVEAAIALSILLVAYECTQPEDTLARRAPWLVAFAFGLLHGFGFAGALAEIGLPPHEAPIALLFFNVGVELGQLGVIAVAALVSLAARRAPGTLARAERVLVYAMGAAAAYWSIERTVALFSA